MKKFISMVMAAAMVVSLVPATAFAATGTVTGKVVDAYEITVEEAKTAANLEIDGPQLQLKVTDANGKVGATGDEYKIKLHFDKANVFDGVAAADGTADPYGASLATTDVNVYRGSLDTNARLDINVEAGDIAFNEDKDTIEVTITENNADLREGDIISIDLGAAFKNAKVCTATVKVTGDLGTVDAIAFASIVDKGIKAELDDDCKDVAPEEVVAIDDIVVEPTAGADFAAVIADGTNLRESLEFTLKLSKGFEWANVPNDDAGVQAGDFTLAYGGVGGGYTSESTATKVDGNELTVTFPAGSNFTGITSLRFTGLEVEATSAKADATATVTVKLGTLDSVKVTEVVKVVDMAVIMSLVDADEDVPVIYSGVNVANDGITDDSDHKALEVSIKETFVGSWSNHKDWTLSLPEGVYVAAVTEGVEAEDVDNKFVGGDDALEALFAAAYNRGEHKSFEFKKRTFNETHDDGDDTVAEIKFTLTLVADPGFVGDVVLTLEGAALETQEVTIAKFVSPMTVKAEQNDVIIDYRYTEVPTDITVTEAEAGLWEDGLSVWFQVERTDMIQFEGDAVYTVNEESDMEVDDFDSVWVDTDNNGLEDREFSVLGFTVTEESDEEAAVVTINGIELFMQRNIPAGPYDLTMSYAPGTGSVYDMQEVLGQATCDHSDCTDDNVGNINDYSDVVHEAFINVVTAGRDQDDASFTTEVVVPVGENYIIAGETKIELDVPAYINAAGYTMLPVRAVATALGINNNAVQWDQATKTVIIMYGQRIITMTAGSSVVYVSGTAIPAKSAVEIVDGRAFLGLRDLATTLGVANIAWDGTTNVATLNPKA